MNNLILEIWWVFCSILVYTMVIGFILLETGWVDRKHMFGISVKNVCMLFASNIAYWILGFGLMYGESINGVIGNPCKIDDIYDSFAWQLYQSGFATIAGTIISGAISGRTTIFSNVIGAALISGVIYPIHGHWIWNHNGWLVKMFESGVHDYAGSCAIHFIGGVAALIGCYFAKKRNLIIKQLFTINSSYDNFENILDDFENKIISDSIKKLFGNHNINLSVISGIYIVDNKKKWRIVDNALDYIITLNNSDLTVEYDPKSALSPHLASSGVLILMIGWLGFNGGSSINPNHIFQNSNPDFPDIFYLKAASVIYYTIIAACSGALSSYIVSSISRWLHDKNQYLFDPFPVMSGAMAGMVSVTAICDKLNGSYDAFYVGLYGGIVCFLVSRLINYIDLDDPVDAISVHGGGGIAGMTSLILYDGNYYPGQIIDLLSAFIFTGFIMWLYFNTLIYLSKFPNIVGRRHLLYAENDIQGVGIEYPIDKQKYKEINKVYIIIYIIVLIIFGFLSIFDNVFRIIYILSILLGIFANLDIIKKSNIKNAD